MSDYKSAYSQLNVQQKKAVDKIDGPVMVIAGPGTGKTQLLSVRAANILERTDADASNLLCLTFTEAAATEMKDRLASLIGQDGYRVPVMTFHSFGTDVINRFPEYFYQGAQMQPIDDIRAYKLLLDIFSKLPLSSPLAVKYNDQFSYLKDSQTAISQLKKAAINPDQLSSILESNQEFIIFAKPIITDVFSVDRITKSIIPDLLEALEKLRLYQSTTSYVDLSEYLINDLEAALEAGTTPPITKFKNNWLRKNSVGKLELKEEKNTKILKAFNDVYKQYQNSLEKNFLFDYDDMVMQVIDKLSNEPALLAELQEQYQYFLVDEFQDTNDAQLKLIRLLCDNAINEGKPDILVVGDDDQAIYKFQGANITNMHQFASWVNDPTIITLTDIYRYPDRLLEASSYVIGHSQTRLSDSFSNISKELVAVNNYDFVIKRKEFLTESTELASVADEIRALIDQGTDPSSIAVIGRNHSHLIDFSKHALKLEIPIEYEQRDNVLDQPMINQIIQFARTIIAINGSNYKELNSLLPELLSYDFFGYDPLDIWELNKLARQSKSDWLDAMLDQSKFKKTANLLLRISKSANNDPLKFVLDQLIGAPTELHGKEELAARSPFYDFYFAKDKFENSNVEYLILLANLKTLLTKLDGFSDSTTSSIEDLISFVDLQNESGSKIVSKTNIIMSDSSVKLHSAHSSKGQEFDYVFILHCNDAIWGASKRGRHSLIRFPANLSISPAGDSDDDRIRLFYVAMTRAKKFLSLSSTKAINEKPALPLRLLEDSANSQAPNTLNTDEIASKSEQIQLAYITDWTTPHVKTALNNKSALRPYLQNYRLSISHLQTFVDVAQAGPYTWLLYNLLKFPAPIMPPAAYGSAVHKTLNEALRYLVDSQKPKSIDALIKDFEASLAKMGLSESDFELYKQKGQAELSDYLKSKYSHFGVEDKSELNLYSDSISISGAPITGMIDYLKLEAGDWQTGHISIIDFKTGKPASSWKGKTEFEKIKLHRYNQQLLFYKLLMTGTKRFSGLKIDSLSVDFIEKLETNNFSVLKTDGSDQELEDLKRLIVGVWNKIENLELPDTSDYEQSYKGILKFEDDLRKDF